MPPKGSRGGGRKRTVKRTVRRTTPRSKSKPQITHESTPPPSGSPEFAIADEFPESTPIVEPTPLAESPAPEAPAPEPEVAPETPPPEALAPEPVVPVDAAPEEVPAVEEPAAVKVSVTEAPAPEPETKRATRVRKVMKKRIVVKRVMKAHPVAKADTILEGEAVVPPAVTDESPNPNANPNPNSTSGQEKIEEMLPEVELVAEKIDSVEGAQKEEVEAVKGRVDSREVEAGPLKEIARETGKMESQGDDGILPREVASEREKIDSGEGEDAPIADTKPEREKIDSTEGDDAKMEEVEPDTRKNNSAECDDVQMEDIKPEVKKIESGEGEDVKMKEIEPEIGNIESTEGENAHVEQDKKDKVEAMVIAGDEEKGISERQKRRKTEIFIGGLDRNAKEEDIRKVFGKVGEIVEVRMMMEGQTGKNKGYAFLRYAEASQAKTAVSEFKKVEVCGKFCGAAALEGNDTIFLGSIDKTWKKEDIIMILQEIGVEKIDTVTVMTDPKNADLNRGFAFLELETNRDAQKAYKLLQKRDAFGKGRNVKVAWAEPLNDPDEEEMQKVRSVYVEGLPSSWGEDQVRERFEKFGMIERVVLARNIQSAKRKDFAFVNYTTREAALSCIELFEKEDITDNGSKINVKVSLAKPIQKGKQNKGGPKFTNNDRTKDKPAAHREMKIGVPSSKGIAFKRGQSASVVAARSTNHELVDALRHQTTWKQGQPVQVGYARGPNMQDYSHAFHGGKRTFAALGGDLPYSDLRGYPRARLDSSYEAAGPSYGMRPSAMGSSSLPYQQQRPNARYGPGDLYGAAEPPNSNQMMRPGGAPYYGGSMYPRY